MKSLNELTNGKQFPESFTVEEILEIVSQHTKPEWNDESLIAIVLTVEHAALEDLKYNLEFLIKNGLNSKTKLSKKYLMVSSYFYNRLESHTLSITGEKSFSDLVLNIAVEARSRLGSTC